MIQASTRTRASIHAAIAVALAGTLAACAGPGGVPASPRLPAALAADRLAAPPGRPARLVVVSVAGLAAAAVLEASPDRPVLAALARGGVVAATVASVAPASTYPAHTTFVTGRLPSSHGVPADRLIGRGGVRRALHSDASRVRGATLWQIAAAEGVPVASFDWPATLGADIPFLIPDVVPTRRGETWQGLLSVSATPWLYGLVAARADPAIGAPGPARDALLVDLACRALETPTPPTLLLLRLRQVESAIERHGAHAPAARQALEGADRELGRLVTCLDSAGLFADSALVVLGDRALLPVHTALHPNAVLAEAGLVTLPGQISAQRGSWRALARSNGGSAFVYAADERAALAARRALAEEAAATGLFRVVPAREMIQRGSDRDAWFGLEAEPGYAFADSAGEPRQRPSPARAAGGQLAQAGSPAFVAYGRGVRSGLRVPQLRQVDVGPTLAALLGRTLPDAEGRAMVGVLELPADPQGLTDAAGPSAPGPSGGPAAPTGPGARRAPANPAPVAPATP